MSIDSIPPDLWQFVKSEVANGRYGSEADVVIKGLQLLRERKEDVERLRAELKEADEQLERGEFTEHDDPGLLKLLEEIKQEGREEYEACRKARS
jgi:putative addiction module CopG family antidote